MDIKSINKKRLSITLEVVKWLSIVILFLTSIVGNYLYRNCSVLLRSVTVILLTIVAIYIASVTKLGKLLVIFGKESYVELGQVSWPTCRDALNTTFIVIAVTVVVSLVLWGLDAIIVNVISLGLRL